MKRFHLPSYLIGLGCGVALLLIFFGTKAILSPTPQQNFPDRGTWQRGDAQIPQNGMRFREGDETERTQRMAESFGMTVEELEKELESGKTMMEIAEERGAEMPFGGRRMRDSIPSEESGSGAVEGEPDQSEENTETSEEEDLPPVPLQ